MARTTRTRLTAAQAAVVNAKIGRLATALGANPEYAHYESLLNEVTRRNDAGVDVPATLRAQYDAARAIAKPHIDTYYAARQQVVADALREAGIASRR